MARFAYSGVTFAGASVSGELSARDESHLRALLHQDGILLLDSGAVRRGLGQTIRVFGSRFDATVTRYFRYLATLIGAGVSLSKALDGLMARAKGAIWREITEDVARRVRNGSSLAGALTNHDQIFGGIAIPMIAAGEQSGRLADVLERIANYRERSETLRRKLRTALVYPAVVSLVALLVVWIMLVYVVPTFSQMFASLGAELPRPTRMLLAVSQNVSIWGPIGLALLAGSLIVVHVLRLRPTWRYRFSYFLLRIPVIGDVLAKVAVSHVARTASAMLENGVPLLSSLETAAKTAGNVVIERIFVEAADAVARGEPLSRPLGNHRIIPPLAAQILSTGEETANMSRMFGKLADYYESEVDSSVALATSILEPALVVVMGVVVAGILVALYLPMFDILGQIGG